ncbi:hypothetical protein ACMFMG_008605 [Clarireedia jacksonii]
MESFFENSKHIKASGCRSLYDTLSIMEAMEEQLNKLEDRNKRLEKELAAHEAAAAKRKESHSSVRHPSPQGESSKPSQGNTKTSNVRSSSRSRGTEDPQSKKPHKRSEVFEKP